MECLGTNVANSLGGEEDTGKKELRRVEEEQEEAYISHHQRHLNCPRNQKSLCISSYQHCSVCLSAWCANLYYQLQSDYHSSTCKWQAPASFHPIPFFPLIADINIDIDVAISFPRVLKSAHSCTLPRPLPNLCSLLPIFPLYPI